MKRPLPSTSPNCQNQLRFPPFQVRGALLLLASLILLTAATCSAVSPAEQRFYWLTPLETLSGYTATTPTALNESGTVLCQASANGRPRRSFLWSSGIRMDLGSPSGGETLGNALNDLGQVAGTDIAPNGTRTAFRWQEGSFTALPRPAGYAGAEAWAIANDGRVAGDLIDVAGGHHACIWAAGEVTMLPVTPGRPYSHARGLNEAGDVVGATFAVYDPAELQHAGQGRPALWRGGELVDLGLLPGHSAGEARAVSKAGQVVGFCAEPPAFRLGFSWVDGQMKALGSQSTDCFSVNGVGDIAGKGAVYQGRGVYRTAALLWGAGSPHGFTLDEAFEAADYWWNLTLAAAINETGQIAGYGSGGAFLLTPQSADLRLELSADTVTPSIGEIVTVTATVRNLGPDPAYNLQFQYSRQAGLDLVSGETSSGRFSLSRYSAFASIDSMVPGAVATIKIKLRVRGAGEILVRPLLRHSNSPYQGVSSEGVTLHIAGTSLPDLVPAWNYLDTLQARKSLRRQLSGSVLLDNRGTAVAGPFEVRFYLRQESVTPPRLVLVDRVRVEKLGLNSQKYLRVNGSLPLNTVLKTSRVLMVVDEGEQVAESVESNNTALSELLETNQR